MHILVHTKCTEGQWASSTVPQYLTSLRQGHSLTGKLTLSARLADQQTPGLPESLASNAGLTGTHDDTWLFLCGSMGFELRPSCLPSEHSSLMSHLPALHLIYLFVYLFGDSPRHIGSSPISQAGRPARPGVILFPSFLPSRILISVLMKGLRSLSDFGSHQYFLFPFCQLYLPRMEEANSTPHCTQEQKLQDRKLPTNP